MAESKPVSAETLAMVAAVAIQDAYEDAIEGDSETTAHLMVPILAALECAESTAYRRAIEDAAKDMNRQGFDWVAREIRKLAEGK